MAVTVTVETGAGVTGANSYVSLANWKTYAAQRGWDYSDYDDDALSAGLIRAAQWIDTAFVGRFPGVQTGEAAQAMQWPRKAGYINRSTGAFVAGTPTTVFQADGWPIPTTTIPALLIQAQNEAAWREVQSPGAMAPDLDRGGSITSIRAGSVGITYGANANPQTIFKSIDAIMSLLLGGVPQYTGRAVRA